jgi:hypothetical protein
MTAEASHSVADTANKPHPTGVSKLASPIGPFSIRQPLHPTPASERFSTKMQFRSAETSWRWLA